MNVLFVTVAWPQEGNRNLYSDLMCEFKKNGHEVFVASADEHINETRYKLEEGLNVLRISTNQIRKAGKFKKAFSLAFLSTRFKRNINKYYSKYKFDLIINHTPPITLSGLMIYLKKKHNAFYYLLLKDIWPHSSVDLNIIKKNGLVYKYFRWHEKRIYTAADAIGCMSPKNEEYVLNNNKYLDSEKVEVCPNAITPQKIVFTNNGVRGKYNIPPESTLFIFSGNLSKGHGLSYYLDIIESLRDYHKAYFAIGGSGTQYPYLKKEIKRRSLKNIFFYHRLPVDEFSRLLAASDVGVVLLDSRYTVPQFPSRLLAYLEAGKPVLCAVNKGTDIGDIVENAGCGISTIHGDKDSLIAAIKNFSENKTFREGCGINASKLLEEKYTTASAYSIIMENLN